MLYPCNYGSNPPLVHKIACTNFQSLISSRDSLHTRKCHANANPDAKGVHTKSICPAPTFDVGTIRIYHECEGRIEKSVQEISLWHHEACLVMTNCDPEGQIFLSYPHTNNGFFFLLTTVFFHFKISFRCNFT